MAAAVWMLIGDGLLDVSRPVAEIVPEFATNGKDAVTVEQVMLHTAGFPNAVMPGLDGGDAARRRARFATWTLEWEPGTRFEYHGTSAGWVLADVIERLSGTDFRDFVEQRVSKPLGLPRLLGIPEEDQPDIAPFVCVGDALPDDRLWLDRPAARAIGVPGGGGIMRAADLALFYQGVLHNPGGLWDAAVLDDALNNVRCVLPDNLLRRPREPHARAGARGRRRAARRALRQLRRRELAALRRPRGRAHAGRLGGSRDRPVVRVLHERPRRRRHAGSDARAAALRSRRPRSPTDRP